MDDKPPSPAKSRSSMIGSAFAVVKNYFTPERATIGKGNPSVGITPLTRSLAALTLDDSSHDSTDSFRTTFSQQDDSFQSTASYVEQIDDSPDCVADQTVIVQETLLESSANNSSTCSIDINCTVNDGIDSSINYVSDSNDSPQVVYANVAKKPVIIKDDFSDISAKLNSEYHKNIEDILEDVNDDGSILSDIQFMSDPTAIDIDDGNKNTKQEKCNIIFEDNSSANPIKTDNSITLVNTSNENGNIGTPVSLKAKSVINLSPNFIPAIVITQVSNEYNNSSPVSEPINCSTTSIDSVIAVIACDTSLPTEPDVSTATEVTRQESDNTEELVDEDIIILSDIKYDIPMDQNDITAPSSSTKDHTAPTEHYKEELVEVPFNEEISEVPYNVEVKKELSSQLTDAVKVININIEPHVANCIENTSHKISVPIVDPETVENDEGMLIAAGNPIKAETLLATSESTNSADAILNISNKLDNNTVPLVANSEEAACCLNAILNATNEPVNTTDDLLDVTNEPSVTFETVKSAYALINSCNEQLNATEPSLTLNTEESLNVTNEPLNSPVKTVDVILNDTTTHINITVPASATVESPNTTLNVTNELIDITVPPVTSETANVSNISYELINSVKTDTANIDLLNVINENCNITMPLVTSQMAENPDVTLNLTDDSLIVTNEPMNTTVPIAEFVDVSFNVSNNNINATVPCSDAAKIADASLNDIIDPMKTTVNTSKTADSAEALLNVFYEPLNTTVPSETPERADASLIVTDEPINTAVATSKSADSVNALLNPIDEPMNTTVVTSEAAESADALLNVIYENINTIVVTSETAECANALLNVIYEPLNTTVPSETAEFADASLIVTASKPADSANTLLNVTDESINSTVPSETTEIVDASLIVTDEPINTTVVISETVDSADALLNVTNEHVNKTEPSFKIVESADASLIFTYEPTNTTVPLVSCENAEIADVSFNINVENDTNAHIKATVVTSETADSANTCNSTVPSETTVNVDASLIVTDVPINTTVVISETVDSADALLNVTNEPTNSSVPSVIIKTPKIADASLNYTYEPIITTEATSETVDRADALLNITNEHINITMPSTTSETADIADDLLTVINGPINTTVATSETAECANASLNGTYLQFNLLDTTVTANFADVLTKSNKPLDSTMPLVFSECADNAEAMLNVTTEPIVTSESADNSEDVFILTNKPGNSVPLIKTEVQDCADSIINITDEVLNNNAPKAMLHISTEPIDTKISFVITDNTDSLNAKLKIKDELIDTTVSIDKSKSADNAEAAWNLSNEPTDPTVSIVTSESADKAEAMLNVTNEPFNTSVPIVTPESAGSAEAVLNMAFEPINTCLTIVTPESVVNPGTMLNVTNEPVSPTVLIDTSESADNAEAMLNITNEPVNTTVPIVTSKNADSAEAVLNMTFEPVNTSVPVVTPESVGNAEAMLKTTNELVNTSVPIVISENAGSDGAVLNITNEVVDTSVFIVTSESASSAEAVLNMAFEPITTSMPTFTSDHAETMLNISNEPVSTTMPIDTSESADNAEAMLNTISEPVNTTVPIVTSENAVSAGAVLNITNEVVDTSVLIVTSESASSAEAVLNMAFEPITTSMPTFTSDHAETMVNISNEPVSTTMSIDTPESADNAEGMFNTISEPVNTTVPIVISESAGSAEAVLNMAFEPINTSLTIVTPESVVNPGTMLNITNEPVSTTMPIDTSESADNAEAMLNTISEPVNTTVPIVTSESTDSVEAMLSITNELVDTTVHIVTSESAGSAEAVLNMAFEPITTSMPTVTSDHAEAMLNTICEPVNITVPIVTSESTDSVEAMLSITNELVNTTVHIVTSETSAEAVLNITSEPVNTTVPIVSPESADGGDSIVNESVNITVPLLGNSDNELNEAINLTALATPESADCSDAIIGVTNDPANTTASLVVDALTENIENILNVSNISITVPHVTSESEKNVDDILNISNLHFVDTIAERGFVKSAVVDTFETVIKSEDIDNYVSISESAISTEQPLDIKNVSLTALPQFDGEQHSENSKSSTICNFEPVTIDHHKTLAYIQESFVVTSPHSETKLTNTSLHTIIPKSDVDVHVKTEMPIGFDKCLEDFKSGGTLADDNIADIAIALPSLDSDESEMIYDCDNLTKYEHFNIEAMGEFIEEHAKHILTPISESRENSLLNDSPAVKKIKFGDNLNSLHDSITNRLHNLQSSTIFDVSPINASPLVSQSLSPTSNSLKNSPMQQEKLLQSTPEPVNDDFSDVNQTFTNDLDMNSKPAVSADVNLNTTHIINVDVTPKNLNETQLIRKHSLNETVTLSPLNSMNTTHTINTAEEFTQLSERNHILLDSTVVLENVCELDPNATVLLTGKSDFKSFDCENADDLVVNKTIKNQTSNLSNSPFERKPLSSMENNKMKLENLSEMLFDLANQENSNSASNDNNKNKNMAISVSKEQIKNNTENTMGSLLSSINNVFKSPIKSDSFDNFDNPVFSNAADLDIFNTDFQPPTGVTGRESLYLKFDPLYSARTDQTIFVSPLIKSENATNSPDASSENSLQKLKAEISRLHELYNKREDEANEKLNYLKLRNEEVSTRCQIEQEKLDKLEKNEEVLEKKIRKHASTYKQMDALAAGYNEMITSAENDLQKLREDETDASAVKTELESSKQHLKSAEDAFMDVLAKYEKISATVPALKANNEQKKKKINELQRESIRIDERVRFCESSLAAEMEEIKRAAKIDNDQFGIETTRLTAQLRKTELTYKNTKDTFDNIVGENEKLANLCDDIIAGKS